MGSWISHGKQPFKALSSGRVLWGEPIDLNFVAQSSSHGLSPLADRICRSVSFKLSPHMPELTLEAVCKGVLSCIAYWMISGLASKAWKKLGDLAWNLGFYDEIFFLFATNCTF